MGSRNLIIGIDPGKRGGIAWGATDWIQPHTQKMPATVHDLAELIYEITDNDYATVKCYLERVGVITREKGKPQGVNSMFTFGRGFGQIEGVLAGMRVPYEHVGSQVWQSVLKCLTGGDKNVSKAKAQQLFPGILKMTHAIADATLIWEYGKRTEVIESTKGDK